MLSLLFLPNKALAIEDTTFLPNNKFGIHILFPYELEKAAELVNSNGGQWGFVTIPIQSTDRNLEKWQEFMDKCRKLNVIPIIRIATYAQGNFWTKPTIFDHIDFANFLNSLAWPTKNHYVIVYNEPNSNLEWGGSVDPASYALELSYTIDAFKRVNPDFFIISAGLDSHAPNRGTLYQNSYSFLLQMDKAVPGIFSRIDGMASHSYPNKNFSEDPSRTIRGGVITYREELAFIQRNFGRSNIPVFITETGWEQSRVSEQDAALFLQYAFENVWQEQNIVAVTPFLLNGAGSAFSGFSLLRGDGSHSLVYDAMASLPKIKGTPTVIAQDNKRLVNTQIAYVSARNFEYASLSLPTLEPRLPLRVFLKWLFER